MAIPGLTAPSRRIALVVVHSNGQLTLCPFYAKCDGILVIDPCADSPQFHPTTEHTADAICDVVLKTRARRLICGFVSDSEKQKLWSRGIDVRLASCACQLDELAAGFDDLPFA
jgi:hypothetical protein